MLHEVTGDLMLTRAQALAHGVSPNEHFDTGLARTLREAWPAMAKDFRHYAHQVHPKPGELWAWKSSVGKTVFNLLTQDGEIAQGAKPGRASTAHVNHALKRLRHELEKRGLKSLALPRLSTGAGGLDWKEVKPLIEQHLGDLDVEVFIYATYRQGQQADEKGL